MGVTNVSNKTKEVSKLLRVRMGRTEDLWCLSVWKCRRNETKAHGYRKCEERGQRCEGEEKC